MTRSIRIYEPQAKQQGQVLTLSAEAGHHVGVVLRLQPDEMLTLFSGNNQEFYAKILHVKKNRVEVEILSVENVSRESMLQIHLFQGLAKGDKIEWIIQKAAELGAVSITPFTSSRTAFKLDASRLEKKCQQWQAIAIAACEQCGRNQLLEIKKPLLFDDIASPFATETGFVLDPKSDKSYRDYVPNSQEVRIIIGPEGGLSRLELDRLITSGYSPLRFGPRVLRTETAAISAISVLQSAWGDLH